MIRSSIRRVAALTFARSVAVLSGGQLLAAVIPIFAAPVLGRIYTPAEYGSLGTYMAIANVLGVLGTLQYHQAISLQEKDAEAYTIVDLVLSVSLLGACIAGLAGLGMYFFAASSPAFSAVKFWSFLLPFTILTVGQTGVATFLAARNNCFAPLARISICCALFTTSGSLVFGALNFGVHGLFAGYALGQVLGYVLYWRLLHSLAGHRMKSSFQQRWFFAKRYRRFPAYTAPTELIGTFNMQAPVFAITTLQATDVLGEFGRARQLIGMPLSLFGSAIGQVFRQRAVKERSAIGGCRSLYVRTGLILAAAGFVPFLTLIVFAPAIFRIILGANWESAGDVVRILAPVFYLQLVCSPISSVFYVMECQLDDFVLSATGLVFIIASMAFGAYLVVSVRGVLIGFTIGSCIIYLAYIFRGWQISKPSIQTSIENNNEQSSELQITHHSSNIE